MNFKETADKKIQLIAHQLSQAHFQISPLITKQFNYELDVQRDNDKVKVLVYFGKKGNKTVIQGNIESDLYKKIKELVLEEFEFDFPVQTIDEPVEYIGSDESGKGDIFGPLVTAAVFVNASSKNKLDKFGIRDSKDLSDNLISELASKIKTITGNVFSIVLISPAKYNELYDKFKNLNKILNWSHSKAIETILEKSNCNTVITDKFSNKDLTVTEKATYSRINFIQTPKAEKYTAVAAASILARDSFNKWFNNQKKLGYNLPKGASEKVDETVYDIFNREGIETLRTLTKMHFKTIKKIIH